MDATGVLDARTGLQLSIGRMPPSQQMPMMPDPREDLSRLSRIGCGCLLAIIVVIVLVGVLDLVLNALR
jgi:hypothetical protein